MKFLIVVALLIVAGFWQQSPSLKQLRALYGYAVTQKDSAAKFEQLTTTVDSAGVPVLFCYKGVAQVLQARFNGSPFNKLKRFNAGKQMIENAIARDTLNVEMRMLRYGIQLNAPGFLGYKSSLQKDETFLKLSSTTLNDAELKTMVMKTLALAKKND